MEMFEKFIEFKKMSNVSDKTVIFYKGKLLEEGTYTYGTTMELTPGGNSIVVKAIDQSGNTTMQVFSIMY